MKHIKTSQIILAAIAFLVIGGGAFFYFFIYSNRPEIVLQKALNKVKRSQTAKFEFEVDNPMSVSLEDQDITLHPQISMDVQAGLQSKRLLRLTDGSYTEPTNDVDITDIEYLASGDKVYVNYADFKEDLILPHDDTKWLSFNYRQTLWGDLPAAVIAGKIYSTEIKQVINVINNNKSQIQPVTKSQDDGVYEYSLQLDEEKSKEVLFSFWSNEDVAITKKTITLDPAVIHFSIQKSEGVITDIAIDFTGVKYKMKRGNIQMSTQEQYAYKYSNISYSQEVLKVAEPDPKTVLGMERFYRDSTLVMGDLDAEMRFVEYVSLGEPFAARFYDEVYSTIKKDYFDTGKMSFSLRPVGLGFVESENKNFEAFLCGYEQDKGLEMYELLLKDRASYNKSMNTLATNEDYKKLIENNTIDLDKQQFNSCMSSSKYKAAVAELVENSLDNGVEVSPAFVIYKDGYPVDRIDGIHPVKDFENAILSVDK